MESGYALMQKKSRGDPTRTGDHLVPNQVRYQLRYTPCFLGMFSEKPCKSMPNSWYDQEIRQVF